MTSKINTSAKNSFLLSLLFIFFLFLSNFTFANDGAEPEQEHNAVVSQGHDATAHEEDPNKPVDIAAVAFEHILDSHSWHLWGDHEEAVSIPLPVIIYSSVNGIKCFSSARFNHGHSPYEGYSLVDDEIVSANPDEKVYDFSITKNVAQLMLTALILFLLFTSIARAYKSTGVTSAPKGKQSFFEPLITFVRDDIAKTNIGRNSDKYVPYLLTVFFLILSNNVLGLIPIGANLTGNIAFTFVLSFITLIVTNVNANKHYWHHIFAPPAPKALYPILVPLEIVGIFTKPFALMIRLFANITAGHIIVISLVGLIFVFKTLWISPVAVGFALFIDVLECLVALLQAYIFTLLTALFIGSASADHNEDGVHNSEDEKATVKH
ncbi:MAG: F0F1 ATP synthase subunit A [Bacteroidetes bacterium]|nr:F0F1 ATP synthase subunit A [Bacteroidota bacterium]